MSYANADSRATSRSKSSAPSTFSNSAAPPGSPEGALDSRALDPRLVRYFEKLCSGGFFGKIVVSLQNGRVVDVRTEQTRKLDEL